MTCICGNKQTELKTITKTINVNGTAYCYETTLTYCPKCGEEWYTWEQACKNSEQKVSIQRQAYGLLTPQEMKAIREKHGLTVEEAANLFLCPLDEWLAYENGKQHHSNKFDRLLRMFDAAPEITKQINKNSHYLPIQPRENHYPATL